MLEPRVAARPCLNIFRRIEQKRNPVRGNGNLGRPVDPGPVVAGEDENRIVEPRARFRPVDEVSEGPVRVGSRVFLAFAGRILGDSARRVGIWTMVGNREDGKEERAFFLRVGIHAPNRFGEDILIGGAPDRGEGLIPDIALIPYVVKPGRRPKLFHVIEQRPPAIKKGRSVAPALEKEGKRIHPHRSRTPRRRNAGMGGNEVSRASSPLTERLPVAYILVKNSPPEAIRSKFGEMLSFLLLSREST